MRKRIAVVVLGDLGHSPRMQNHCLSLADSGHDVDLVGYHTSEPHHSLTGHRKITLHYLPPCPTVPTLLGLVFKFFWQFFTLAYWLMMKIKKPDMVMLQNPPGLPAMLVCWMFVKTIGKPCKWLVDWHNYTFSIFGLRFQNRTLRGTHWFVRLVKHFEFGMGRLADGGLCVTDAMREDLAKNGIFVKTHYDQANSNFKPLDKEARQKFLTNWCLKMPEFTSILEQIENDKKRLTAMIVSSTSWTPDEDFDLFFNALKMYDDTCLKMLNLPQLLVVVTGKGPLKEHYIQKANEYDFRFVTLVTPWLTAEDYPKVLACADLGVSLHFSSSGLDLPMKVVDMQASALPVLSADFACAKELVQESSNGFLFADHRKLHDLLVLLFSDYPQSHILQAVQKTCSAQSLRRQHWHDSWASSVQPYLTTIFAND